MNTMYELESMQTLETGSSDRDQNLSSLDFSKCSTSSPSFFDQGSDNTKMSLSGMKYSNYPSISSPSTSIFEFPSLDELDTMGCDLLSGIWDEDQVQSTLNSSGCGAEALNFTFSDSGGSPSKTFDLKSPSSFSNSAPTLTELNMEDSLDSLFSLKPKGSINYTSNKKVIKPAALSMPITPDNKWKVVRDEHSGLSISPTTWNNVKNSRELSNTGLFAPKVSSEVVSAGIAGKEEHILERKVTVPQRREIKLESPLGWTSQISLDGGQGKRMVPSQAVNPSLSPFLP